MNPYRLFLFFALLAVSCRDDGPKGTGVESRPPLKPDKQVAVDASLSGQKIGRILQGKTSWFRDGGYQKGALDRAPELYLFYYSASW